MHFTILLLILIFLKGVFIMFKKTVTYTDYNGNERTEDFYFNLSKAELIEMELTIPGGMDGMLKKIIAAQDTGKIIEIFKTILLKAYGEKSEDGKRFMKSPEISKAFSETEAYSIIFVELAQDAGKAAEFINNIIPSGLKPDNKTLDTNQTN